MLMGFSQGKSKRPLLVWRLPSPALVPIEDWSSWTISLACAPSHRPRVPFAKVLGSLLYTSLYD